ncbi:hypothetical protein KUTeg_021328 [Tegillarca granosa]|uniref:Uncharacterized protein n=1 Tax=Tegillarca granosa TaxID=220873 RepID=A0ABQ9ED43_TEGGR|nr:hypothetical protein KUTeg_021328 [Tegillarca granosa]
MKPGSSRASSTGHHVEFLGIGANEGRAVSSRYSATGSYRTRSSHSYENSAYSRSEDESSTDVIDGKFSASPSMRKKPDSKEPVSSHVSSQRQASFRKKNDTKTSSNFRNPEKQEYIDHRGTSKGKDDKNYKQKRTNDDEDGRSKSYSKTSDRKEQSRKDSYREKKQENGKSRLYEPGKKHYSDDDDDYNRRQEVKRRVSSRSVDNRGRSKYDKEYREYQSSTSQGSIDYKDEIQRSSSRHRHRDDPEKRYRERSESRSRRHGDSRERSHSMSRSSRDRQYYDSDHSSRKRSRSETRSRSKSYSDDRYYRDKDRQSDYDDRSRHDRHHRDFYRDTDHHSYSDSRHYDDRARSQGSRSHKQKYRRPIR